MGKLQLQQDLKSHGIKHKLPLRKDLTFNKVKVLFDKKCIKKLLILHAAFGKTALDNLLYGFNL